ncbi:hypothetical protein Pmani_001699 [Petrolisthes manimaculis]|uniref:Uncharacterized protein n=1 Tax=Petrolisthes manimaculis TaxID=1843537 RepID=A0AAE1QK55_9EUCA|nr:hypothetical protein Pmani_001699 [Petrolisthes manimaculis]
MRYSLMVMVSSTAWEDFWRQQASALAKQFIDTQQQLENLQQTHESLTRQIHQVFNEDQVTALSSAAGRMHVTEATLRVASVTSDMGPANVAMWRTFGVGVSKTSGASNPTIKCCVEHPADS